MEFERWAPIIVVKFRRGVWSRMTLLLARLSYFWIFQALFRAMAIEVLGSPESGEPFPVEAFRRAHFFEEDLQSPRQIISHRLPGRMLVQYILGRKGCMSVS